MFEFVLIGIVILYIVEHARWNKGMCIETGELWQFEGVDTIGRTHFVSYNHFHTIQIAILIPTRFL